MHPSLIEFLRHIRDETAFCLNYTGEIEYEAFVNNQVLCRAIVRSLEIIGEASKNIPLDF